MYCTVSFCSIFLVLFLTCSAIATLRVYRISKGCAELLWRYAFLVEYGLNMYCTVSFCSIFLVLFFNLLYYSYATRIQNFKRLRQVVVEICFFWAVYGVNMYCTVSFYSIFLVLFFNLLLYSYATSVQNFKRPHRVVVEIYLF